MMDKVNGCIFFIEDDDLLKKFNTKWDKSILKKNLIASLSIIKSF